MRSLFLTVLVFVSLGANGHGAEPAAPLAEPWQAAYAGDDATGKHVLGLWHFDGDEGLQWHGAKPSPEGRFGGCLESFATEPPLDKPHRVMVKNRPGLSPAGAFALELWIKPEKELADYTESFLLDKKYASNDDYQLVLGNAQPSGERALRANLGFGADFSTWHSKPCLWEPGVWHHVAFLYDGTGTGSFVVDGRPQGSQTVAGRKSISPGKHGLSIGDRIGSNYHAFPGFIDEVRIVDGVREYRDVAIEITSPRSVFVRMEPNAKIALTVKNLQRLPLQNAAVSFRLERTPFRPTTVKIDALGPGETKTVEFAIDTSLRPDIYSGAATLAFGDSPSNVCREAFRVQIVPRPLQQFPVLMWGVYRGIIDELPRLKTMGFTHALGLGADYDRIWKASEPTEPESPEKMAAAGKMLDECLAQGMTVMASLSPGGWLRGKPEFHRVNRKGETPKDPKKADICGLFPEAQRFCRNVGESVGKAYAPFPAFGGALIHTEVRDHATLCFHPHDLEAYKKATGQDVPIGAAGTHGVDYAKLADFPADRVIPDDHPLLTYYRWYWKQGDGWNGLNTAVDQGIKTAAKRPGLWTFHDPAVRTARVFGSGGSVDVISQWTYSYPDPIRIGLATDELLATAAGASHLQDVMKMTQIIWYRGQTAPQPKKGEPECPFSAAWEQEQPDAKFITIAPMHLREAFWTKIARPIRGIMYHGWQSLVPCEPLSMHGYRFTHPATQNELARLTAEVVRPLGPMLLALGPETVKNDVAFLESFSSEMFARRGTFGWGGGWAGDGYHALLYAGLQPDIVLDETIASRGLDGYRVLVLFDCDVLTKTVCERIKKFQSARGVVVGDERLAPAIKPDVLVASSARTGRADQDKATLQALGAEIRKKLAEKNYLAAVRTTSQDVIPYRRTLGSSDYVFVVNDRRGYGQYVGQHGVVMENGLAAQAQLEIKRPGGFVYNLVEHREVLRAENGKAPAWNVDLSPCDGRVFLITERPVESLSCRAPKNEVAPGQAMNLEIVVGDGTKKAVDVVVPVEVNIRDPEGRLAEFSGYHAAVQGSLVLKLEIAQNDVPGEWQAEVKELASGRTAVARFTVTGLKPWPPVKNAPAKELANPVQPQG